ncbi:hypothetical protein G6027_11765, partial [Dietzia sp. SLG310A2-38A2]|nr:hypothetical protein [Dietzia sp. SLG310A2-38A2]
MTYRKWDDAPAVDEPTAGTQATFRPEPGSVTGALEVTGAAGVTGATESTSAVAA